VAHCSIECGLNNCGVHALKLLALLLAAATFLVGCATPYKPPTSGPTATVSFDKPTGSMFGVTQFNSIVSDEKCTNPALLSTFSPIRTDSVEQVIPAGTRIYIRADLGRSESDGRMLKLFSCKQVVSFVPLQGEKYRFRQDMLPKSCVVDVVLDADRRVPQSVVIHPAKTCQ
jgi:hypothetical protein